MNKLLKGSIAGAAGIALLLGGASTFALWNDATAPLAAGAISSGTLTITKGATGVWSDTSATGIQNGTTFDPTSQKIVPGDTLQFAQTVSIAANGKNLKGKLTFDPASIGLTPSMVASYLDYSFVATVPTSPVQTTPAAVTLDPAVAGVPSNSYTVIPNVAGSTTNVDVKFSVTFKSTVTALQAQTVTDAIKLANLSFTLTQIRS